MANPHIISGRHTITTRRRRKPTQRGGRRGRIGAIQSEGVGGPTVGNGDTGGGDTGGYPGGDTGGGGPTQTETVTKKPRGVPIGAAILVILGVLVLSKGR